MTPVVMEVLLLGPLEVRHEGQALRITGGRARALLVLLALNSGRVMSAARLIELLWADEEPATAANALQVYVSTLRKALEPRGAPYRFLASDRTGYMLALEPHQLDSARFEQLFSHGHQGLLRGDFARAERLLDDALSLWRGPCLTEFEQQAWALSQGRRLRELRLAAEEDQMEVRLARGRHVEEIPRLQALIAANPLRERLRAQLMLALYRGGRAAEAAETYRETRALMVDELGMEPGPELQRLLRDILNQESWLGSASESPPTARRDNLPAPLTSFVGRKSELAEIAALIGAHRLVTLTGVGGIGKTRLALRVAEGMLGNFDRGVWFVGLESTSDPRLVPQAVATALGFRPTGRQTPLAAITAQLGQGRYLLVLDNCEHVVDACGALLAALLTVCPGLTVLATSREALGVDGEVKWSVPPLDVPPRDVTAPEGPEQFASLRLFMERATTAMGVVRADETWLRTAADVCRRLEGVPLAIELAAARLGVLSLDEISARLSDRFTLLQREGRTGTPRQRTLQHAIDWSYDLLTEDERSLLSALSVFAGGATLEAIDAVWLAKHGEVLLATVSGLARKSMVRVDQSRPESRYQLLETIREYAANKLTVADDRPAVEHRHSTFFIDLAERAAPNLRGPSAPVWVGRLAVDHDNLRAALGATFASGRQEAFCRVLASIWWFWYLRCFFEEGRRWLDTALRLVPSGSDELRVRLLIGAGQLAWAQDDHEAARGFHADALVFAREIGNEALEGESLARLSLAEYTGGMLAQGAAHLGDAVRRLRQFGPQAQLAEAMNNLGWIRAFDLGDLATGATLLHESLELARECGDPWTIMQAIDSVARLTIREGDLVRAEALQVDALQICLSLGDSWSFPRLLTRFVELAVRRAEYERAVRLAAAAQALRAQLGTPLSDPEAAELKPLLEKANSSLSAREALAARTEGARMTLQQVADYACGILPDRDF